MDYGYIPDAFAPEDALEFDSLSEKYNPHAKPAIITWDSFEPHVQEQAKTMDKIRSAGWNVLWWIIAKQGNIPIWESNQGQLGSCAGWSAANGYMTTVLYQMMLGAFRFVPINPLAMWVRTKNWLMKGGQSMSKVMTGGNKFGNYPIQLVGEYSTQLTRNTIRKIEAATDVATLHQFGACRLMGSNLAAKIVLCLRASKVVCIGNSVRVSGSRIDSNNMRTAVLGGKWSHATLLDGYVSSKGTQYVHWTNSHGNRYKGLDRFGSPESGCWMTLDVLERFCNGRYCDAFCIDRAEAPTDTERKCFIPFTQREQTVTNTNRQIR